MANKLYIKEYETIPLIGSQPAQIWNEPASVEQTAVALSSAAAPSANFGAKTKYVCITSDVDTAFVVSPAAATTAVTGTHFPLWSKNYLCFAVRPGDAISAVLWT